MKEISMNPYVIGIETPSGKDIKPTYIITVSNNIPEEELTKLHLLCMNEVEEIEYYAIRMLNPHKED